MECSITMEKLKTVDPRIEDLNPEYAVNPFDLYTEIIKHKLSAKDTAKGDFVADFYKPSTVDHGQLIPYSIGQPISSFMSFGHGLFFYFYAAKYLAIIFALLTAVSMIQMGFNLNGKGLSDFPKVPFWMKTTLINSPIFLQLANTTIKIQNVTEPITLIEYVSPSAFNNEVTPTNNTQSQNATQTPTQSSTTLPSINNKTEVPVPTITLPTFPALAYSFSDSYKSIMAAYYFDTNIGWMPQSREFFCFDPNGADGYVCIDSETYFSEILGGYVNNTYVKSSSLTNAKVYNSKLKAVILENVSMESCECYDSRVTLTQIHNSITNDTEISSSIIAATRIKAGSVSNSNMDDFNIFVNTPVKDSTVHNSSVSKSEVTNSTISHCQLENSIVAHSSTNYLIGFGSTTAQSVANYTQSFKATLSLSTSVNYYYFLSAIENSTLINVPVQNIYQNFYAYVNVSYIYNSSLRSSNINNSTITSCIIINSDIYNSTLVTKLIINAVVIDGQIFNRTGNSPTSKSNRLLESTSSQTTQEELIRTYTEKITKYFQALDVNENQKYFQVNLVCDCVISVVFILSIYALKVMIFREMPLVNSETMTVSKFTVKIQNMGKDVTKTDVMTFVKDLTDEQIVQIEFAYDFNDAMNLLLKKKDLEEEMDELKLNTNETAEMKKKLERQQQKHNRIVRQLTLKSFGQAEDYLNHPKKSFRPLYAFVIFNRSTAPKIFMQNFKKAGLQIQSGEYRKQYIGNQKVTLSVPGDSRGINFEHITAKITIKVIKLVVFAIAMIGMIVFTTYICNFVEEAIENSVKAVQCDSSKDFSKLDESNRGSPEHQCFCDKNIGYILNSQYRKDCGEFILSDASNYYAPFVSVVILTIMNLIIEFVVDMVFDWTGFINKSTEMWLKVLVLFGLEYANTVAVLFTTATQEISDVNNPANKIIQQKLELISPDFYFSSGNKMIMLSFFGAILPHIILVLKCWIVRLIYDRLAEKQTLQKRYIRYKRPFEFELDGHYVYLMTSVATALTFSAAIPILPLFCFLSFIIAFWVNKYVFIRYCKRPLFYDKKLIIYMMMVMPFTLVFKVFFSISVYGDPSIFLSSATNNFWIEVLTTENPMSTAEDINTRILKSLILVIIVAILLFIAIVEIIGMLTIGTTLIDKFNLQNEEPQFYLKEYPSLLYNSTLSYDFRMQPKYKRLLINSSNSDLSPFSMVNDSEKQQMRSEFTYDHLEIDFESYMKNFLLSCKNEDVDTTQSQTSE